jgi:hypothetical protein
MIRKYYLIYDPVSVRYLNFNYETKVSLWKHSTHDASRFEDYLTAQRLACEGEKVLMVDLDKNVCTI